MGIQPHPFHFHGQLLLFHQLAQDKVVELHLDRMGQLCRQFFFGHSGFQGIKAVVVRQNRQDSLLNVRQDVGMKEPLVLLVVEDEFLLAGETLERLFQVYSGDVGANLEFLARYPVPGGIEDVPEDDFIVIAMQQTFEGEGGFPLAVALVFTGSGCRTVPPPMVCTGE